MNIYAIGGMHKIPAGREENFAGISCRICRNLLSYGCCPPGNRKEVGMLYILISFLVSVAAGIACHCLNARRAVNVFQQGRTPGEIAALRGFAPLGGLLITLSAWLDAILIISRRLTKCKQKKFSHSRASFRATKGKAAAFHKSKQLEVFTYETN